MMDILIPILIAAVPATGGVAAILVRAWFYAKVGRQALAVIRETEEDTIKLFNRIQEDPEKKELAKVLRAVVKTAEGFTQKDLDQNGQVG